MYTFGKIAIIIVSLLVFAQVSSAKSAKRKSSKKMSASGKANLSVEMEMSKDKKSIDFDKAFDIEGQRRDPLGALLNQKQADKDFEFVKIRLRWRKEMVESAYDLNL